MLMLGENTEKYKSFWVPIKKEFESNKTITYKIKFFDSFRFMSSSLSGLVDNLSEGLHNDKCTDCKSCLECISTEDELLISNCLKCSKSHKNNFDKYLIKRFASTYKSCDGDISKLMLIKAVYPCQYMDSWKIHDTLLPEDVFETFRNKCIEIYELYPAHFLSAARLA